MSERNYDNGQLNDYLLGSLPDAAAEIFDELSFTDENFADTLKISENALIDAYINDELTDSTRARFKAHYLASPLRREKVAFARSLRTYIEAEKETTGVAAIEKSAKPWFEFPVLRLGFTFAALLLVFAGLFFLFKRSDRAGNDMVAKQASPGFNSAQAFPTPDMVIESQNIATGNNSTFPVNSPLPTPEATPKPKNANSNERGETPVVFSFVLAPPLRGAGRLTSINVPKFSTEVSARLQLEPDDSGSYTVKLTDESGSATLWTSGKVKAAGGNGSITVRFPAKLLRPQIYNFTVSGTDASGKTEVVGTYPFRVVRQ